APDGPSSVSAQSSISSTLTSSLLLLSLVVASLALQTTAAFIIRSALPFGSRCNETAASECFHRLFAAKEDTCKNADMRFRCVDYHFLDDCFKRYAGICSADVVGLQAAVAYRRSLEDCDKRMKSSSRALSHVDRVKLTATGISRFASGENSPQLIAALGSLQTQCTISKYSNCSNTHVDQALEVCESNMKGTSKKSDYIDFDRHKLLRIKLDTAKKLLGYPETNKERECLTVRSTLTEIYQIHHRYCFHVILTRCLCERQLFERYCGIRCESLEASSPDEDTLAWDQFKGVLTRSSQIAQMRAPSLLHSILISVISYYLYFR
ncbi:hypothetical protein PMAYCL1PPCAC_30880, partial [Pristionchus mayeri]